MTAKPTTPGEALPKVVSAAARALRQEFEAVPGALEGYAAHPVAGCLSLRDEVAWKATARHTERAHRRRLWQAVLLQSRMITANVLDHLSAQAQILTGKSIPLYAHMTLTRVAVEGAARICYLLDPGIGYDERLLRSAVMQWASAESSVTAARGLPATAPVMPGALDDAIKTQDLIRDRIARAGITVRSNATNQPTHLQYARIGVAVPLRLHLTDLVEKRFAGRPSWYRLTSGIVHSADWMLTDLISSSPLEPNLHLRPDILGIGAAALSSIDACAAIAQAYADYYGHNPEPAARANAQRARIVDVLMNEHVIAENS